MLKIVRSPQSARDICEIALFISRDDPAAADRLIDLFDDKLRMLAENPALGRSRDELAPGVRSFAVGNYLLFYRAAPEVVELVRILHGARDLRRIFKEE